jgi:cell division protein FtsI (penicillin-binding protein 3)
MLEQATSDDSSARGAQVTGYRVGGKSGTAQLIWATHTTHMGSFIGVAPADDPQFTVAVFVHDPQHGTFGGTVAAPSFSEMMSFVLQQQQIPRSWPDTNPLPIFWENNAGSSTAAG